MDISKKTKDIKILLLIMSVIEAAIIVGFILMGIELIRLSKIAYIYNTGIEVQAKVTGSKGHPTSNKLVNFWFAYEYIDGNGISYKGISGKHCVYNKSKVAEHIGKEITVKIDKKGNSTDYIPTFNLVVYSIVTAILACFLPVPIIFYKKNK